MEEVLYLNHRDKKSHHAVRKIDMLSDLLLKQRRPVLFVGEGNFSFTVAFAALRECEATPTSLVQHRPSMSGGHKVWEGIVSSRYEPVGPATEHQYVGGSRVHCKPAPVLSEVQLLCVAESASYCGHHKRCKGQDQSSQTDLCFQRIKLLADLPAVPDSLSWQYRVDARHIPPDLVGRSAVVWFQCPCSPEPGGTAALVLDYLLNTARHMATGGYVCVGISRHPDYVGRYGLQDILQGGVVGAWYRLVGADVVLVRRVLECGYRHEGESDVHHYLLDCHVTLVFQRKECEQSSHE